MKKIFFILFTLCLVTDVIAQKQVKFKSFNKKENDLSAVVYSRKDENDSICALVKVQYPKGTKFEGNVVGDVEYKTGEYWVYMCRGSRNLNIKHPNYAPLMVVFPEKVESKATYVIDFVFPSTFKISFYVEAGMVVGSTMGPEFSIGTYIGNFNIELSAMLPLGAKDNVYCQTSTQNPEEFSEEFEYKPSYSFAAKVGYGIKGSDFFRITPQIGMQYMGLSETAVSNTSITPAKGSNCASLTVGCKLQYLINKHFGVSLTPEYALPIAKSNGYKALSEASDVINKWNNGIGAKLAVNVEF